ncbi:hypothetical protein K2173_002650 [Erythroxylum novogranatense]|uniref:Uncharacterized protein n=1 Tax=Erythroxylum novogranatense TaxID=1862640 RepID=A0AAV8SWN4_9ROSI|nr:hypothetical protein K2173_002650 [Erythroxylum novogranatense]
MTSKPWGGIGSWAAEAEREESEEREAAEARGPSTESSQGFPSLREAATAKPKKKKMSLNEFHSASGGLGGGGRQVESKGLTPEEMLRLPTGPKERSPEEMQYGRGFSYYNRSGPSPGGRERDGSDGSWGGGRRQYGGFEDERRGPPPRVSDFDQPSRADEVDNWAVAKRTIPSFESNRQPRYVSLGGGSRADDVDNWAAGKKSIPTRSSTFGSGFRDSGSEQDRWTRGGIREQERERPKLSLDPPKGDFGGNDLAKANRPNPFGAARPREEVLAEKGLDWKKMEMEMDAKKTSSQSSRPSSAQSSRPSSAQSTRSEGQGMQQGLESLGAKPRPKVNPFGDAKPREVLLQERGKDWRKIDLELEHRGVDRPETDEERSLKEEIETLKKELQKEVTTTTNRGYLQESGVEEPSIQELLSHRERELEKLIRDLDDKVRFGQKAVDRPGSGAGRSVVFPERPHSQSGSFDDSRSIESTDRPRSRGLHDSWSRPGDERRSHQGGRGRVFLGGRDFDRPGTRTRW